MRFAVLVLPALAASACNMAVEDHATPTAAHIDRVERALSRHPCIGSLAEWERNYRFSRKSGLFGGHSLNPDLDVIEFHLRKAATVTIRPGRNIVAPKPNGDWPDSPPTQSLDGRFSLGSGSLNLSCRPERRR